MIKFKNKTILGILFLFSFLFVPFFSYSESEIEVQGDEIRVKTIPENPEPYQEVTIVLSSYATDINKAIITWKTKEGVVLSGIGKTTYSFTTQGPDTRTIIAITINPAGSVNTITKNINIIPSEIQLLWESVNGYTPPFYKGKALATTGSKIKVVAIPNTRTIKSDNGSISYLWKNNDSTDLDSSGYNKDAYVFNQSMFEKTSNIEVTASSVVGDYIATKGIEIPIYKPKMVFYKKSPIEGVDYSIALDKETIMIDDEMTIVAEPYFMPLKGKEDSFTYKWKINDNNIPTPTKKTELTIRPTSRDGYATINMTVENMSELFQKVTNSLKINL